MSIISCEKEKKETNIFTISGSSDVSLNKKYIPVEAFCHLPYLACQGEGALFRSAFDIDFDLTFTAEAGGGTLKGSFKGEMVANDPVK